MRYVIFVCLFFVACSGAQKKDASTLKSENLDLDPMLIRASADGTTESIDLGELFQRAYARFSDRRFEEAVTDYEVIIKHFPQSRFFLPSLYNAGLAYERLNRWEDATRVYQTIIKEFPHKKDTKDAYYRLAVTLEQLGSWNKIVAVMEDVLLRPGLTVFDRVEAHVRRGDALREIGSFKEAADGYRTVLRINADAPPAQQVAETSHLIVRTYFGLGHAFHMQVQQIRLVLPPPRMGRDLKDKADKFMTAQANYIRALRFHHPQWSMAAGYMIGRLYEDFYTDILSAEIPDDLSEEQLALYFEELRKQIRPLMERAVQVYKKNLSLSKRIGAEPANNAWVAQTSQNLRRLNDYLEDSQTQSRAERFVRSGRNLRSLWEPVPIAQDTVSVARKTARSRAKKKTNPTSNDVQSQ